VAKSEPPTHISCLEMSELGMLAPSHASLWFGIEPCRGLHYRKLKKIVG
jgi:hypothetical protein